VSAEPPPEDWNVRVSEAGHKLDNAAMHLEKALTATSGEVSVHVTEALRHIGEAKSKLRDELK
jgi:hypothetical protein